MYENENKENDTRQGLETNIVMIERGADVWRKEKEENKQSNPPKYSSVPPSRLCLAILMAMVIPKWTKIHNRSCTLENMSHVQIKETLKVTGSKSFSKKICTRRKLSSPFAISKKQSDEITIKIYSMHFT